MVCAPTEFSCIPPKPHDHPPRPWMLCPVTELLFHPRTLHSSSSPHYTELKSHSFTYSYDLVYLFTGATLPFRPGNFTDQNGNTAASYTHPVKNMAVSKRMSFQLYVVWGGEAVYHAGVGKELCQVPCQR